MPELQVIAQHTIRAGAEDELWPLLEELMKASRAEPGNLGFDAFRKSDDPRRYVLIERYASREAFATHRATPHFERLMIGRIAPLLERRVIELFDVTDGPQDLSA